MSAMSIHIRNALPTLIKNSTVIVSMVAQNSLWTYIIKMDKETDRRKLVLMSNHSWQTLQLRCIKSLFLNYFVLVFGLIRLRIGVFRDSLWMRHWTSGFHKLWRCVVSLWYIKTHLACALQIWLARFQFWTQYSNMQSMYTGPIN